MRSQFIASSPWSEVGRRACAVVEARWAAWRSRASSRPPPSSRSSLSGESSLSGSTEGRSPGSVSSPSSASSQATSIAASGRAPRGPPPGAARSTAPARSRIAPPAATARARSRMASTSSRHHRAEGARRGPHLGVARLEREGPELVALERLAPREELDDDERQREDVRPRAGRAEGRRELLGRAVARRERLGHGDRGRRRGVRVAPRGAPSRRRSRGACVRGAAASVGGVAEHEDVPRLHVAMDDAALVRDGQRLGDRGSGAR